MSTEKESAPAFAPLLLPGFAPLKTLWQSADAVYPSEAAARWAIRLHRALLIDAKSLALVRGQVFVHRERFIAAIEAEAIDAYRRRFLNSAAVHEL